MRNRTVEHQQDPAGSQSYTYRYDAQGNTLSDGENTYLYDCLNHITEVKTKAWEDSCVFTVDFGGSRLTRKNKVIVLDE